MKMILARFDDDENPNEFTVTMSLAEMGLLYRFACHIAPARIDEIFGNDRWGTTLNELAEGASDILNRFFDSGADDVIPCRNIYDAMRATWRRSLRDGTVPSVVTDPIERLLNEHWSVISNIDWTLCRCGDRFDGGPAFHRRHVAENIRAVLGLSPPEPWHEAIEDL